MRSIQNWGDAMETENARIRLKFGVIEIEYEGKSAFLQDDLPNLIERVVGLYATHGSSIPTDSPSQQANGVVASGTLSTAHSTNTIASHLGVNSGPELAMAAAAHLTFAAKKDTFSRKEILTEMKDATTYYNANMSSNLGKALDTLVKAKRLNQVKVGVYALSASERSTLEAKLAQLG